MNARFGHVRLFLLAAVLGLGAFYAGTRVVFPRQTAAAVHPLTHRPIAGIATDRAWMDRQTRQEEEAPDKALSLIGIRPGMVVADVGAGSGYMTMRVAPLVGPSGHVYATDIQPALVHLVAQKAAAAHAANVTVILASDTNAMLPAGAVDLALLVDVYHEFQHPVEMLRSIRESLKADGRLVLIEYREEDPSIPIAATHRMSVAGVRAEVEPEGFVFDAALSGLPRQHIIVFRKS